MIRKQPQIPLNPNDKSNWLELVVQHVQSLSYGVVEIGVHDSRVIRIEKTERVRLDQADHRQ